MRLSFALSLAVAVSTPALAATIQPVGVVASDTFRTYDVINLINGSGLVGGLHDTNWRNMWMSTSDPVDHWLVFDLGRRVSLSSTTIWQYGADFGRPFNETARGVKDLGISISMDGITFTPVADVVLQRIILTEETRSNPFAPEIFALNGDARFVRFDLNSNYGQPWTGLSEVRFGGAVPEAGTWALLIAGFGLVGAAARRRRRIARA